MRVFAGGREVEVPTDENGNADIVDVRRAANIPDSRMLVQQTSAGENFIVPRRGHVQLGGHERFMDAPRAERGSQ